MNCPRLDFSLWKKNPRFSARDVIGPSTSIWDSHVSCRHVSSPERRRATRISILPTIPTLHLVQTLQYDVSWSVM